MEFFIWLKIIFIIVFIAIIIYGIYITYNWFSGAVGGIYDGIGDAFGFVGDTASGILNAGTGIVKFGFGTTKNLLSGVPIMGNIVKTVPINSGINTGRSAVNSVTRNFGIKF